MAKPAETGRVGIPGNLYVRVRPSACAETVYDTGAVLAENGLLKGHTPESWRSAMAPWLERTARTDELAVLLKHEAGEIGAEIDLVCAGPHTVSGR